MYLCRVPCQACLDETSSTLSAPGSSQNPPLIADGEGFLIKRRAVLSAAAAAPILHFNRVVSTEAALKFMSLGDAGARNHNFAPHESTVRAWIRARIRRLFHCHATAGNVCWHSEKVILVGNSRGRVPHVLMDGCDKERKDKERERERIELTASEMQHDGPTGTYPSKKFLMRK